MIAVELESWVEAGTQAACFASGATVALKIQTYEDSTAAVVGPIRAPV
jgi:hypothetical protein